MTRPAASLRVVSDSSASAGQSKIALIATTDPDLFRPRFAEQLDQSVFVVDNGPDALSVLENNPIQLFFADFRQLNDRWTGQRFLKHVQSKPEYAGIDFYLMAEVWHAHQEQWNAKCGARGSIKRSPDVLAQHILGESAKPRPGFAKELGAVDAIFGKLAGPMRGIHIEDAREALELGQIEPTIDGYIAELATKLATEDRRKQFLAAVRNVAAKKKSDEVTEAGDPWMDEVNSIFKGFAGGLGARLMVERSLIQMERSGTHDRGFYANDLASRLVNPGRRADFLAALRKAKLLD